MPQNVRNLEWLDSINSFDQKLQERFLYVINSCANLLITEIYKCQSPIERLFALELQYFSMCGLPLVKKSNLTFTAQKEISIKNNKFIADFLITAVWNGSEYKIVVECDGHDFHEKTKEQAARDKRRDRILTSHGYAVFRFTGSELWGNTFGCLEEILDYIFKPSRSSSGV